MKRSLLVAVLATAFAAACWPTRPNPRYCTDNHDCIMSGLTMCDVSHNECVAPDDASVPDDMPRPPDLTPMCSADLGCAMADKPICDDSSHTCRACQTAECGGALHCNTTSGACVECLIEADCASIRGVCSASNTCLACKANSECASGLCDDGKCAAEADVAYVDNGQAPCTGADGSRTKPYCEIVDAVAGTKPYVLVTGHGDTKPYKALTFTTARTVTILGPGKAAAMQATIFESGKSAILVNPSSGVVNVVAHGFELAGSSLPALPGVKCQVGGGTSTLTVRDSYIHASGGAGVDANSCDTTLARNLITMNSGGGVKIAGGMFTIENNFIVQNTSLDTPGVSFDNPSSGTFRFNTVAKNVTSTMNVAAGIACGSAGKTIADSIVIGNINTTTPATSQFEGTCNLSVVAAGTDASSTPTFVSGSDFHLAAGGVNSSCCVNRATTGPALDVDGEGRPKSGLFDIGADEVE